jgi:hypothetical protein
VRIDEDVFIGPGAIILPSVVIGHGSVVTAGSVVTSTVSPMTVVQGNPARPVARCGVPLGEKISLIEFSGRLKPLPSGSRGPEEDPKWSTAKDRKEQPSRAER